MTLCFDGSNLGKYEFDTIVKTCFPINETGSLVLNAYILYNNIWYKVIMRKMGNKTEASVIDEIKPLFGISKIGTHIIRLNGVPKVINQNYGWYIKTNFGVPISNIYIEKKWEDYCIFNIDYVPRRLELKDLTWYYETIQKILVLRECFYIRTNVKEDFYQLKNGIGTFNDVSIKEIFTGYRKLSTEDEKYFFNNDTKRNEILMNMLNITSKETINEKIEILRDELTRIFEKLDKEKLPIVRKVVDDIYNRLILHFTIN